MRYKALENYAQHAYLESKRLRGAVVGRRAAAPQKILRSAVVRRRAAHPTALGGPNNISVYIHV